MKRKTLLMALFLGITLALMCSAWADDDDDAGEEIEYECCCNMFCEWEYYVLNVVCQGLTGRESYFVSECKDMEPPQQTNCESENYADTICKTTKGAVTRKIQENRDEICPQLLLLPVWMPLLITVEYIDNDVDCLFVEKGCSAAYLLREDVVQLDTLREFRDEVLSTSNAGRKLIALYDEYSHVLIEIFEEYPAIKAHAKEMLEKIIPGIEIYLNGEGKAGLLSEEISAEADILIEEIDSLLASPLKETLTKLREDVKDEGILE